MSSTQLKLKHSFFYDRSNSLVIEFCFSLISGLSAIAFVFVYAGPNKIDMTVVAVVLGILAPVLSFGIASGSGLNALSNVSQISQNFGINTGAAYYVPGNGQPGVNNNSRVAEDEIT